MQNAFTIFYSWQSDLKPNRNFLLPCIEKAIKAVKKRNSTIIELDLNLDRDTEGKSGSPDIAQVIFDKINQSDIFICDVTIVNNNLLNRLLNKRASPNPNVLIELGYAVQLLGWERIICLNNLLYSKAEQLPFDIRGNRITSFSGTGKESKEKFIPVITKAIESCILNYDQIVSQHLQKDFKKHDKGLFFLFTEICSEDELFESISMAVDSLFTSKYYYGLWDGLMEFYKKTVNQYLDKEIDIQMKEFIAALSVFKSLVSSKFHNDERAFSLQDDKYINGEITPEELVEYKQGVTYSYPKQAFDNDWAAYNKRVQKTQDQLFEEGEKVKVKYRELIMKIKRKIIA